MNADSLAVLDHWQPMRVALIAEGGRRAKRPKKQSAKSRGEALLLVQLEANGYPMPRTQWRFDPSRDWATDFDWMGHDVPLVVEIEGMGRHITPAGYRMDMEKYNRLTMSGVFLLRFLTADVTNGRAIKEIGEALRRLKAGDYAEVRP